MIMIIPSVDFKYHDISDFNKINMNKNSSLAALHLNIALWSKQFEDLQNFLYLLKHFEFNWLYILF